MEIRSQPPRQIFLSFTAEWYCLESGARPEERNHGADTHCLIREPWTVELREPRAMNRRDLFQVGRMANSRLQSRATMILCGLDELSPKHLHCSFIF